MDQGRHAHHPEDLSGREDRPLQLPRHQGQQDRLGNGAHGELFVEEGSLPGEAPLTLTGADGTIWHPEGRWAATVVRLCGGICILDPEKNFEPAAFLQFNKDSQDQYKVEQVDKDTWKVVFDKIHSPGHEIGFSPDGKFLVMMNNLRENNCSVFSCTDPDPTKWRKVAHVEDPLWRGKYPNPFHMVFSMDSSKLYLSILHPRRRPAASWWSTPRPGRS